MPFLPHSLEVCGAERAQGQEGQTYFAWHAALSGARSICPGKRAKAAAGRIGRGTKFPWQAGQVPESLPMAQAAQ